jgi:hypothetical protein
MEPLTIVVSVDGGEQVVPGGRAGFVASLMHECGFQSAKTAFHRCIVEPISLPAHGLDHPGRAEDLAVGGGVLAAAIGMVDEPGRRLLPLYGHGEGGDGQFRPHVVTHRPSNNFAGEEIAHGGQIKPPFGGGHVGAVGQPNLMRPCCHKGLFEQIRRDRQVVMAVCGAPPKLASHACLYKSGFDPSVRVGFRHSSQGGHSRRGGVDAGKDASCARAGKAGAIARCLRRALFRAPYGILARIDPLAKLGPKR